MAKKTDPQTIRQTYQLAYISEYTTDIQYLQGKANVVADALSRPNETLSDINGISNHPGATSRTYPESSTTPGCEPNDFEADTASSTRSSLPRTAAAPETASIHSIPQRASTTPLGGLPHQISGRSDDVFSPVAATFAPEDSKSAISSTTAERGDPTSHIKGVASNFISSATAEKGDPTSHIKGIAS